MVAGRVAIAEFFQVGADQAVVARVGPVPEHAEQPGAIHRLGRSDMLEKIQGMGAVAEITPGTARLAFGQVPGVVPGHGRRAVGGPLPELGRVVRQFIRQRFGLLQLLGQPGGAAAQVAPQQGMVACLMAGTGVQGQRVERGCGGHHGHGGSLRQSGEKCPLSKGALR
ncbi:hypothetical protein D9M71_243290 [compost metagenome]